MNYVVLTFDFIQDLDFGFFKVNFQNICILNICYLIDVKRNDNKQLLFTTPNLINVDNDHAVHINLIYYTGMPIDITRVAGNSLH